MAATAPASERRALRVLQAHDYHAGRGGSEVLFEATVDLLRAHGHRVGVIERDNRQIIGLGNKLSAFRQSLHSREARAEAATLIANLHPNVAHVHNLFPLLSPSILEACRSEGIPVVLNCQDYKLTCPAAQHLWRGSPCEACLGGSEYHCALRRCRGDVLISSAYALRNAVVRWSGSIRNNVNLYMTPTEFAKRQLVRGGFPADRVEVVPNMAAFPAAAPRPPHGRYLAYVGRISPEKGLLTLLDAARATGLPVKIAGDPAPMPELPRIAPPGVEFLGELSREQLPAFYAGARALVVPSVWFEVFGIVCAEAMGHGLPIVASRIGGLPEVVEEGVSGLLFEPGDSAELAAAMDLLWRDDALFRSLGDAARRRALREFSPVVYYERLTRIYAKAMAWSRYEEPGGSSSAA